MLLDAGADPAAAGRSGYTLLHWAASYGQPELLDMLLARSPATRRLVHVPTTDKLLPLHLAVGPAPARPRSRLAVKDPVAVVDRLLRAGALLDAPAADTGAT